MFSEVSALRTQQINYNMVHGNHMGPPKNVADAGHLRIVFV